MCETPIVYGVDRDEQTRCRHYHRQRDIIAIRFRCCDRFYCCHKCHAEMADHQPELWKKEERDTKAILCGVCNHLLTIREYIRSDSICPSCSSSFNPGCKQHLHLYFEI